MTGLVRKAILFAVCGLFAASAAMASTPSAANSETPVCISLVGDNNGTPDLVDAPITIIVRDLNNLPVNNALVVVDFTNCHNLQLCTDQLQPGVTAVCNVDEIRVFTDVAGQAVFSILGHANNGPLFIGDPSGDQDPNNGLACGGCATIRADNVTLLPNMVNTTTGVSVSAYDQDGGGVGPADLACWLGDNFGVHSGAVARNPDRSDYNCSCDVGPADLALWLQVNFGTNNGNVAASPNNCTDEASTTACAVIP